MRKINHRLGVNAPVALLGVSPNRLNEEIEKRRREVVEWRDHNFCGRECPSDAEWRGVELRKNLF